MLTRLDVISLKGRLCFTFSVLATALDGYFCCTLVPIETLFEVASASTSLGLKVKLKLSGYFSESSSYIGFSFFLVLFTVLVIAVPLLDGISEPLESGFNF